MGIIRAPPAKWPYNRIVVHSARCVKRSQVQLDIITLSIAWRAWLAKNRTSTSGSSLSSTKQGRMVFSTTYQINLWTKKGAIRKGKNITSSAKWYECLQNSINIGLKHPKKKTLTDWSTMGMRDCNTFATLNLILGTLQKEIKFKRTPCYNKTLFQVSEYYQATYLSFDALITTGSSLEHVISEPITGARSEIARKIVIRYKQ